MERPIVVVHRLPADTKPDDIHDLFQKSLLENGLTDEFSVIYPVLNCKGLETAEASKRVALLVFWDQLREKTFSFNESVTLQSTGTLCNCLVCVFALHSSIAADCLCDETFENIELEPMKDQIVLSVSSEGNQISWVEFGNSVCDQKETLQAALRKTVQTRITQAFTEEHRSLETTGTKLEKLPSSQPPVVAELGDGRRSATGRHGILEPIRPESKASQGQLSTSSMGNHSKSGPLIEDVKVSVMPKLLTTLKDIVGEHLYCCKAEASDHVVFIYKGDITKVSVDAVVTPAGASLMAHTPVAEAIARAAGKATRHECKNIIAEKGFVAECEAKVTTGGRLCQIIIHAVMPVCSMSETVVEEGFGRTLYKCLHAAEKLNLASIAIPSLGPDLSKSRIARKQLDTLERFCTSVGTRGSLRQIHLVEEKTYQALENKQAFEESCSFVPVETPGTAPMEPNSPMTSERQTSPDEKDSDICAICRDPPQEPITTLDCQHRFCQGCIERCFEVKPVCPECGAICGPITGDQPTDGKMTYTVDDQLSLNGYPHCGTIVIKYDFPPGVQAAEHPNPRMPYSGTTRTAYLPDNTEGREVLQLLRKAFDARLTFTVGQSVTTGKSDQLTWNDIHHKTSSHGGDQYGYPDPNYLQRVKDELAAKGIKL